MGSDQDFILLSFRLVRIKRIRRQGEVKIPNTNVFSSDLLLALKSIILLRLNFGA